LHTPGESFMMRRNAVYSAIAYFLEKAMSKKRCATSRKRALVPSNRPLVAPEWRLRLFRESRRSPHRAKNMTSVESGPDIPATFASIYVLLYHRDR
jgi:hypothetical protein